MFIAPFILFYFFQIIQSDVTVYKNNSVIVEYDDQTPDFGPSFPSDGLQGYITITNPRTACQPIDPPPNIPTYGYHWIALIPRTQGTGACDFQTKILNAEKANFSAVIVYNFEDQLLTMGPSGKDVKIPATLITHSDGITLIERYLFNQTVHSIPRYHLKITPPKPFKFGIYIVPFAVVIGVSFLGLIGFMIVRWFLGRRRTRQHRLPKSALKQLRIKKFAKGDRWDVCAICLDDYVDGAKLRILPCDHAYHMKCIDPWLLNSRRQCPVCKRYVFPNLDNPDGENNGQQQQQQQEAATEHTPLMQSSEDNSTTEIPDNRSFPTRRFFDHYGSDEDLSVSTRSTTTSPATTTEVIFEGPTSNARRYGSIQNSSTIPRSINTFVNANDNTTDNTSVQVHSVVENVSDIEATDDDNNDERMHSVMSQSAENPAFVNDEGSKTNMF